MARVDYTHRADAYRRARTLPAEVLAEWTAAVRALALPRPARVLDLGAGPGGFLDALAMWFDAPVVAVEPSAGMRDAASDAGMTGRHPYLAANAEALPLRRASVDVAWLSTVIHQFDDVEAAGRELRRVVRPAGHVLVRGFFADQEITGVLGAFPGMDRAARTFPSTDETVARLAGVGFGHHRVVDVVEPWRFDLASWTDRVRSIRHTDSALRPLTDAEFEEGVRVVTETHRDAPERIANDMTLRLLVLTR